VGIVRRQERVVKVQLAHRRPVRPGRPFRTHRMRRGQAEHQKQIFSLVPKTQTLMDG